jgi:hypothetical protein
LDPDKKSYSLSLELFNQCLLIIVISFILNYVFIFLFVFCNYP